jgi:hypothetical protein
MSKPVKLYTLFKLYAGKFSNMSADYSHGTPIYNIAAKSIKQAYYLAGNDVWFNGNVGILETSIGGYPEQQWKDYNGKVSDIGKESTFGIGGVRPLPKIATPYPDNDTPSVA